MTRSNIPGWAFTPTQEEEKQRRLDVFKRLKYLRPQIIKNVNPMYGMTKYSVRVPEGVALSDEDIAIICDDGNTCFGASVDRSGREAIVTIFTD